jgi:hypothetical protein
MKNENGGETRLSSAVRHHISLKISMSVSPLQISNPQSVSKAVDHSRTKWLPY